MMAMITRVLMSCSRLLMDMNLFLKPVRGLIFENFGTIASGLMTKPTCKIFDITPMTRKMRRRGITSIPSSKTLCLKMDMMPTLEPSHMERFARYDLTIIMSLDASEGI
jgi:hypothetical protein